MKEREPYRVTSWLDDYSSDGPNLNAGVLIN